MREIVWDTETTGFDPFAGDRIVEIGAVELNQHLPTGRVYHQYINPDFSGVLFILPVLFANSPRYSSEYYPDCTVTLFWVTSKNTANAEKVHLANCCF